MENIYKHVFIQWIAEKGYLNEWLGNRLREEEMGWSYATQDLGRMDASYMLMEAFTWSDTPEGRGLWESFHQEWVDTYQNMRRRLGDG